MCQHFSMSQRLKSCRKQNLGLWVDSTLRRPPLRKINGMECPSLITKPNMPKIDFTEKTIDKVYPQFKKHPAELAPQKPHAAYPIALDLAGKAIERLASADSVALTRCPVGSLRPCRDQIKPYFVKPSPPAVPGVSHEIDAPSVFREQVKTLLNPKPQWLYGKSAVVTA